MTDQTSQTREAAPLLSSLVERLRGIYRLGVNDGAGLLNGSNEFVRKFETPPIHHEAADAIETLTTERDTALARIAGMEAGEAPDLDCYDAGYLGDDGGGNVEWWRDYIRCELAHAHDFYQEQVVANWPTTPAAALARAERAENCDLDVGCNEAGACYAVANGSPDRCGRIRAKTSPCKFCDGTGLLANGHANDPFVTTKPCHVCDGAGTVEADEPSGDLENALARAERAEEALRLIAGQTPRDTTSKEDPTREHYLRSVTIAIAKRALSPAPTVKGEGE